MFDNNPELIQGIVAIVIVICATALYAVGLTEGAQTVEPQSLFTLYGAILGYVFGRQTGRMAAERRHTDRNNNK